ncbi:MAG: helix-turn-helix domain-containing protein [Planktothrix sp. GU0601_MAG3]|nr:MAG: helix-turn-helix domain-containing protein [Planktothrix sp. GU0601_MAG3]
MKAIIFQAFKYRIYPTTEQQISLAKSFGCCRWYGNYALNLCQKNYKTRGKRLSRKSPNLLMLRSMGSFTKENDHENRLPDCWQWLIRISIWLFNGKIR